MPKIQRALLSVTDKTGVVDFARGLSEAGVELISTGGTAAAIRQAGLPVKDIAEVTGFPEMLDGRVKTIHPRVAAGVLAIRANQEHMEALKEHSIGAIDMVVVNLYAFEKIAAKKDAPVHELIENIDIGGPTMIRAAAENYQDVAGGGWPVGSFGVVAGRSAVHGPALGGGGWVEGGKGLIG